MQTVDNVVTKAGKTVVRQQKASRLWPSLFACFNKLFFVLVHSYAFPLHLARVSP